MATDDTDIPLMTEADCARARPAAEVFSEKARRDFKAKRDDKREDDDA